MDVADAEKLHGVVKRRGAVTERDRTVVREVLANQDMTILRSMFFSRVTISINHGQTCMPSGERCTVIFEHEQTVLT